MSMFARVKRGGCPNCGTKLARIENTNGAIIGYQCVKCGYVQTDLPKTELGEEPYEPSKRPYYVYQKEKKE